MADILTYSDITERTYIVLDGEPYEVIDSQVSRKQQRKPVNQTKLRNLFSGNVIERTFHASEKVEQADIEKRPIQYQFTKIDKTGKGLDEYWFSLPGDPKTRFPLPEATVRAALPYLREGDTVTAVIFTDRDEEEHIISLELPIKVDLTVTEAPPNVKGNTAQGGTKLATLETGIQIAVPLFVESGEVVRINTQTGAYVERVS